MTQLRKILQRWGLEYYSKYYSIYRGEVIDIDDPEKRGRIKIKVPQISGEVPINYWAESAGIYAGSDYGVINLPEKKEKVWVQFEGGNPNYPIWMHGYFKDRVTDDKNYPKRKLLLFKSGQKITIDTKDNFIEVDNNGVIFLLNNYGISLVKNGKKISLGTKDGSGFSAVKGETLVDDLKTLISKTDGLATEVLKLLTTFVPAVPANIPTITAAVGEIKVTLQVLNNTVDNIKSENVNLDG
jgi:phage baseplate assembly protein gpV